MAQDGTIAYSGRFTITVSCNLDLVNYPIDKQEGVFIFEPGKTISILNLIQNTFPTNPERERDPETRNEFQRCQIRTLSYAYVASKVNITWCV